MNYTPLDFYALWALCPKGQGCVRDVLATMNVCNYAGPVGAVCPASAIAALAADGYITVAGDKLMPDTQITLTEKGKAAATVGWLAKIFKSSLGFSAMQSNLKKLCSLPRPTVSPMPWDADALAPILHEPAEAVPIFAIEDADEGLYTVTFSYDHDYEEDPSAESVALLCDRDTLHRMLSDLLDTALYLLESDKIRKVPLFGNGKAYILTFATVADESGEEDTVSRMTIAPILFNRGRFVGKRDSDLDYAQCGANVVTRTNMDGAHSIYYAVICRPDLLDGELGDKVDELFRKVYP